MRREREMQHRLQMELDRLRVRELEIGREEERIRGSVGERRKEQQGVRERAEREFGEEMKRVEEGY